MKSSFEPRNLATSRARVIQVEPEMRQPVYVLPMSRGSLFLVGTFTLALACGPSGPRPVTLASGGASIVVSADRKTVTFERGSTTLLTFPLDAFELGTVGALDLKNLSYDPYWLEVSSPIGPPADLQWRTPTALAIQQHSSTSMTLLLSYAGATATLTLTAAAPNRFVAKLVPQVTDGQSIAWARLRPRAGQTEAFYGLGEWGDTLDQRGKLRPMQMEADLSYESGDTENHAPIPLLIGTRGWGLFVQSSEPGVFDVAREAPDLIQATFADVEQPQDGLTFHLFSAAEPLDVTKLYYDVTGYPLLPATWALGPWIWRDEDKDQAQVLDDVKEIRDLDLATSAIWIDRPYASHVNSFDFDPAKFTDPDAMIAAIHAAGLRLALWSSPYEETASAELHQEAVQNGYYPPTVGILLNKGWGDPIDFTNPAAYAWWQSLIRRYTGRGIEGFKLDYGEDVTVGIGGGRDKWVFHDGSDERTMHRGYQLLYHKVYAEMLPKSGGFLLCRTGRWGGQANVSVIWPGDLDANFAHKGDLRPDGKKYVGGLPASVILGLGLGVSGFPFYASDTGGYQHSPPDAETYTRWFEQTALSTVMEIGDASSEPVWVFTNPDGTPNGRDEATVDAYRQFVRLHLRLFPYEWTYAQALSRTGRAILRPIGLAYPQLGQNPDDEYLFGDDLLVAPVVVQGATTKSVLFPPGTWIDWFDGSAHAGGQRETVAAPLDTLPLYLRAGAIVPLLRPTIDTLAPATDVDVDSYANDAGQLYARIVPDDTATSFTVFDGTQLSQSRSANAIDVVVKPGATFTKGFVLELLRTPAPQQVTLNGAPLQKLDDEASFAAAASGYRVDDAMGGTVWLKLPLGGGSVAVER